MTKFTAIPAWAIPAKADRYTLYETFALLKLEGQWVRLSAADQRAVIGHAVFGKQEFRVNADGTVDVRRSACFGLDTEQQNYFPAWVRAAVEACKKLRPSTFWPGYYELTPEILALA
jgi:hypothetical protein